MHKTSLSDTPTRQFGLLLPLFLLSALPWQVQAGDVTPSTQAQTATPPAKPTEKDTQGPHKQLAGLAGTWHYSMVSAQTPDVRTDGTLAVNATNSDVASGQVVYDRIVPTDDGNSATTHCEGPVSLAMQADGTLKMTGTADCVLTLNGSGDDDDSDTPAAALHALTNVIDPDDDSDSTAADAIADAAKSSESVSGVFAYDGSAYQCVTFGILDPSTNKEIEVPCSADYRVSLRR